MSSIINTNTMSLFPSSFNSRYFKKALEITLERISTRMSDGLLFSKTTWNDAIRDYLKQCWSVLTLNQISTNNNNTTLLDNQIINNTHHPKLLGAFFSIFCYAVVIRNLTGFFWIISTYTTACFVMFFLFRLLGSINSLSEVASHLGFSVMPLIVLEPLISSLEEPLPGFAYVVKFIAAVWAARSASTALSSTDIRSKAFLYAYPCILYHTYMLNLRH
jgi:hypothetical protein